MARLADRFVKEVFEAHKRFTPWTPNVSVALGDVGVLVDGVFEHKSTLRSLGVPFKPRTVSRGSVIDFSSNEGVSIDFGASASGVVAAVAGAKARAKVSFTKAGGAVLQAKDVDVVAMKDSLSVGREILDRFRAGTWDEDWVFVSEVQSAKATTVLVSEDSAATIELEAEGSVATEVPLTAGFTVSKKSGAILNFVGKEGLTPLFALSRVDRGFWDKLFGKRDGKISSARRAGTRRPSDDELVMEDVVLAPAAPRRGARRAPPRRG